MISVRQILLSLSFAFTAYLAARGLAWTEPMPRPGVVLAALGLYLITTWICIFWQPPSDVPATVQPARDAAHRRAGALPVWASILALLAALIVPSAVQVAVGPGARTELYATWVIGGIGALMTILMVRRRPWIAWVGTAAMGVACMLWMGVLPALGLGLVGSVVWVGAAQLLVWSLDRAAFDASRLATLQRAASAWQAAQAVRQQERRVQVQRALVVAGPVLMAAVASGGDLDDAERLDARIAEGRLRDELRGRHLLDDRVRELLDAARQRGATVTVLDEGGLDGLDEAALGEVRAELAKALESAHSDRVYIRTSPHESIAVTVVGRSASSAGPSDEDVVDLWQEIIYPHSRHTPSAVDETADHE